MFILKLAGKILLPVSYTHLDVYKRQYTRRSYREMYGSQRPPAMENQSICMTQDLQGQRAIDSWQRKSSAGRASNGWKKDRRSWKRVGCTDP